MPTKILEFVLKFFWDIIFLVRLDKLLEKLSFFRKFICKAKLVRGGVEFNVDRFVACASSGQLPEVALFTCSGIRVNMPGPDGDTALIAAARHGHEKVICHLLSLSEMDINAKNYVGDTALIAATDGDHEEIVTDLLAMENLEVNVKNEAGDTALIVAAREGHKNIVTGLLQRHGINVNAQNKADESALLEAARRDYKQIVEQLKKAKADEPELEKKVARWQLEQEGIFNASQFFSIVRAGNADLVRKFLLAGMDPNTHDENKATALIIAIHEDHEEIVTDLLALENVKVNDKNEAGDTALIVAVREGHKNIVTRLLQRPDIDVNAQNTANESALLEAARRDYKQIVEQLIKDKQADEPELEKKAARWQLEQEGIYTETYFVRSAARGDIVLTQKYLRAGMDVNARDDREETGLIAAVRSKKTEMVKLLIGQPGIDVNLPNRDGVSAAEIAAAKGDRTIVELLIEAEAEIDMEKVAMRRLQDRGIQFRPEVFVMMAAQGQERWVELFLDAGMHPNAEDDRGNTALIEASKEGQKLIVELLIFRGADVNLRNRFNASALEAAERSGHSEIADLLRAKDAIATEPLKESLLDAIERGDIDGISSALEQGTSPDTYTARGEPILVAAIRHKRSEIVDMLLKRGAQVDLEDRDKKTALMRAAELGTIDIIHLLLKVGGAQIEKVDTDGSTPLMLAIWQTQVKAVQTLIEAGANVHAHDKKGRTVLMIAKLKGHPSIISLFEEADLQEESLEANLLAAAARGDHSEIEKLLKGGANPEVPDEAGNTSIALAAARGWTQVIETLKPNKTLINKANTEGDTPLMQAARAGHLSTVELLLDRGAYIDSVNHYAETALLQAATAEKGSVVKFLVNKGADPNLIAGGTTPLTEACYHGQLEAVACLIEKQAEINQIVAYGFSPLMTAMLADHEDVVELLRMKGAIEGDLEGQVFLNAREGDEEGLKALNLDDLDDIDLNACDREGWTALMVASREGFDGVVKILLNAGAESNLRARDGRTTALMVAASKGRIGVLKLLISVTSRDKVAETRALVEAAVHGHAEAVRYLATKAEASIDGLPKGRVPLVEAAMRGHLQAVQVLLELGASKEKQSRDGLTAIMAAQLHRQDKVVELLIESGCEAGLKEILLLIAASEGKVDEVERLLTLPNPPKLYARDEEGRTALMRACERGYQSVVEVLLRHYNGGGARWAIAGDKDYKGRTPLMWAAKGGNTQIVFKLLELKADIHAESDDRRTALMEACKWGRYEVVKILINELKDENSRRVAVNHMDENENTPLGEALFGEVPQRQLAYEEIILLLEKCGAKFGRNSAEFIHAVRECNLTKVTALENKVDFKKLRLRGKTPLMLCAESGCVKVAQILINKGVDVNDVGPFGVTALMLAVKNSCRDMLSLLLDSGADCNRIDSKESSALIEATQLGDENIVSDLISADANVNQRNSSGNAALTIAVAKENPRLVSLLLSSRRKLNLNKLDGEHRTALTLAHLRGNRSRISEQALPSPEEGFPRDFLQEMTQIERLLIEAGARKGWDEAELILAARDSDLDQIRALLGNVDVNIKDIDGSTPLLIACRNGDAEIAQILIENGANVEVRNHNERTPLMEAAKKPSLRLAELLLQVDPNLDLNAQDKLGETALLEATHVGTPDIVRLLVNKGANINAANSRGETPIIEMAKHPSEESVQILLEHGANACARNVDHRTAIIEASKHGHVHILKMLLNHLKNRLSGRERKRKIVINAIDNESHTAIDWAEQLGFNECADLLRQHGGMSVDETDFVVFTTPHGDCYHRRTCGTISYARDHDKLKKRMLRDAVRLQYEFCDICRPSLEKIDWTC